nr:EOG090X0GP9 [Triops cancriformis]
MTMVKGDVTVAEDVTQAVKGQDWILVVLGTRNDLIPHANNYSLNSNWVPFQLLKPWRNIVEAKRSINIRGLSSIVTKAEAESLNHHEKDQELVEDTLFKTIEVEVRSGDPAVLKSYEWFTTTAAKHLGITVGECFAPPRARHDRLTLLKSVHIYKKHRVQYEIRTYFRHMKFHKLTGSTADTFLEYIQRNLPEGVAMKVTKLREFPVSVTVKEGTVRLRHHPFGVYYC